MDESQGIAIHYYLCQNNRCDGHSAGRMGLARSRLGAGLYEVLMTRPHQIWSMLTKWAGSIPCLIVLASATVGLIVLGGLAFSIGKAEEDKRQFLVGYRDPDLEEYWIDLNMDHIMNSSETVDVLFHGDSTCRHGVDAKQFQDRTGLKAFSISATANIGVAGVALLLERYLENHDKPKWVLLCIHPSWLADQYVHNELRDRFIWSYGSGTETTRPKHARGYHHYIAEGIRVLYAPLVPGIRAFRDRTPWDSGDGAQGLINERIARHGGALLPGQSAQRPLPEEFKSFDFSENALDQLKGMALLTQKHDILFVIRLMPIPKGAGFLSDAAARELRALEKAHKRVVVSRPVILEYDRSLFFDNQHLNSDGADELTSYLAEELKK